MPRKRLPFSAWINDGTGCLFAPPFLTRCLLYRLYDIDRAVLLSHERRITSRGETQRQDSGTTYHFNTVVHAPSVVCAQIGLSVEEEFAHILLRPATKMRLPTGSFIQRSFDKLNVTLSSCRLPLGRMQLVSEGIGDAFDYEIEGTSYSVKSPALTPSFGAAIGNVEWRAWKVTVTDKFSGKAYGLNNAHDWNLEALNIDESSNLVSFLRLEKG